MPWYAQLQIFKNWRCVTLEINPSILKWYWRTENVVEVQRQWRREYRSELPMRLTIARIRDKFETHGTVCDVYRGRLSFHRIFRIYSVGLLAMGDF